MTINCLAWLFWYQPSLKYIELSDFLDTHYKLISCCLCFWGLVACFLVFSELLKMLGIDDKASSSLWWCIHSSLSDGLLGMARQGSSSRQTCNGYLRQVAVEPGQGHGWWARCLRQRQDLLDLWISRRHSSTRCWSYRRTSPGSLLLMMTTVNDLLAEEAAMSIHLLASTYLDQGLSMEQPSPYCTKLSI